MAAVRPLLEVREKVRREIAALYRKLLDLARIDVDSRRSMTVPSIVPIMFPTIERLRRALNLNAPDEAKRSYAIYLNRRSRRRRRA